MIEQFRPLQTVKVRRENTALLALQTKRHQLSDAEEIRKAREIALGESAATLADRETAIFQEIMHKVVASSQVEVVKEKVLLIYKDHQQLEDRLEIAIQQCLRLSQELQDAQSLYQIAQRTREKFDIVLDELIHEQFILGEQIEEAEIEESLANRRPQHT